MKQTMDWAKMCETEGLPLEISEYFAIIINLDFEDEPPYELLHSKLILAQEKLRKEFAFKKVSRSGFYSKSLREQTDSTYFPIKEDDSDSELYSSDDDLNSLTLPSFLYTKDLRRDLDFSSPFKTDTSRSI